MIVGAPRRGRWRSAVLGGSLAQRFGRPSALWLPGNYDAGTDAVTDKGSSQVGLRFGATTAAETSDPVLLDHDGADYLYLPGVAGNYALSGGVPSVGSGAISVRVDVDLDPAANSGKYLFRVSRRVGVLISGGYLRVAFWNASDAFGGGTSCNFEFAPVSGRVQLRIDKAAGAQPVAYYSTVNAGEALRGSTGWVSLGQVTTQTDLTLAASAPVEPTTVGANYTFGNELVGRVWQADMSSGGVWVGSNVAFDASTAVSDGWTINRGTSGLFATIVDQPAMMTDGASDYAEAVTSDTSHEPGDGSFTALWVGEVNTIGGNRGIIAKPAVNADPWAAFGSAGAQWFAHVNNSGYVSGRVADGTNAQWFASQFLVFAGRPFAVALVVDRAANTARLWCTGQLGFERDITGWAALSNANAVTVNSYGTVYETRGVCRGATLWDRALTPDELSDAVGMVDITAAVPDAVVWGDSLASGWPETLAASAALMVVNRGVGGDTSTQIRARFEAAHRYERQAPSIIWAGRNNYSDTATVLADVAAMVGGVTDPNGRALVLTVLNGEGEGTGTTAYTDIAAVNAGLVGAGHQVLDIRRYLIDDGLADAGITPTAQDTADVAADTVPASLRTDTVHLTTAAKALVAARVEAELDTLGWY